MTKTLEVYPFVRGPVYAVRVTADNLYAVAQWCNGKVRETDHGVRYVKRGLMRIFCADWLIRRQDGGFFVTEHDEFEARYLAVAAPPKHIQLDGQPNGEQVFQ